MGSFDDTSTEIEFTAHPKVKVYAGNYRIYYGEDLFNRRRGGNDGEHCVEVFVSYD